MLKVDIMFYLGWYSISSICYKVRGYSSYSFISILRPNADWRGRDYLLMVEDLIWTKKFPWRKATVQPKLTAKYTWGNFYKQNKALIAKLIPAMTSWVPIVLQYLPIQYYKNKFQIMIVSILFKYSQQYIEQLVHKKIYIVTANRFW